MLAPTRPRTPPRGGLSDRLSFGLSVSQRGERMSYTGADLIAEGLAAIGIGKE